MNRATRFFGWALIVVPTLLVVMLFISALSSPMSSGAGMSAANRPIGYILISGIAIVGWIGGTSTMFAMFHDPRRLPWRARSFVEGLFYPNDPSSPRHFEGPLATTPGNGISPLGLFIATVLHVPLLTFLPGLLVGWLLRGGVYDPIETLAVGAMTASILSWTVYLLAKV